MKPRVLWTNQVPENHFEPLHGVAEVVCGGEGMTPMRREEVLTCIDGFDAVVNQAELRVDDELLDAAPRLRVVANVAIGTDNFDRVAMRRRGVVGTNVPDAFIDATADATLALLLALSRRIPAADRYVRHGRWPGDGFQPGAWDGMELRDKTMGVVGFGRIGRAVARRAEAFGMDVLFHARSGTGEPRWRSLDALLSESDVVSLHLPLTQETRGLIGPAQLERMRRSALLINMARGPVIDEAALADALRRGGIAGAALDVFESEPHVPPELSAMSNVILTPHLGGGTRESRRRARRACASDVARVLQGQQPWYPVT